MGTSKDCFFGINTSTPEWYIAQWALFRGIASIRLHVKAVQKMRLTIVYSAEKNMTLVLLPFLKVYIVA